MGNPIILLPPELLLEIIAYLPIQSLHSLQLVSCPWNNFIRENDEYLYHNAAVHHSIVPSMKFPFSDLPKLFSSRSLLGCTNWKTLCVSSRDRMDCGAYTYTLL